LRIYGHSKKSTAPEKLRGDLAISACRKSKVLKWSLGSEKTAASLLQRILIRKW